MTSSVPDEVQRGDENWIEYAIRYDAPEEYRGIVGNIRDSRVVAEGMARQERRNVHVPGLRCTVVQRWLPDKLPTDIGPEQGCRTLRLLAAPFSSHPDWQPEWSTE